MTIPLALAGSVLPSSAVAGTSYTGYLSVGDSDVAVKLIAVSDTASANASLAGSIYTYSISDDKYVLTTEGTVSAGAATFTKGVPTIGTLGGVANNNTTYVVKTKDGDNSVWTVYTGYKAMPTVTGGTIKADYASTVADGMVFCYVDATGATSIGDAHL